MATWYLTPSHLPLHSFLVWAEAAIWSLLWEGTSDTWDPGPLQLQNRWTQRLDPGRPLRGGACLPRPPLE
ncbi:Endothelial Lipase [Manis pentadactyla]|nr:Endothelial Lipase [Manis pentadactyla]